MKKYVSLPTSFYGALLISRSLDVISRNLWHAMSRHIGIRPPVDLKIGFWRIIPPYKDVSGLFWKRVDELAIFY